MHVAINMSVVALYAVNMWIRTGESPSFGVAMGLSVLALARLAVSGWLGAEIVHVHRVGIVETDAAPLAHAFRRAAQIPPWQQPPRAPTVLREQVLLPRSSGSCWA